MIECSSTINSTGFELKNIIKANQIDKLSMIWAKDDAVDSVNCDFSKLIFKSKIDFLDAVRLM